MAHIRYNLDHDKTVTEDKLMMFVCIMFTLLFMTKKKVEAYQNVKDFFKMTLVFLV